MIMISSQFHKFCRVVMAAALLASSALVVPSPTYASKLRIKDITHIKGVRSNQLVGFGLVVGLSRTGDQSISTQSTSYNLIQNFGGRLNNQNDVRAVNAATVMVTAIVPPFAKSGDTLDVTVSSMADAKSLEGGVLVSTQLQAPSGEIVATAQGPISVGGVSVSASGSSKRTAITTSGRVPNGAILERDIATDLGDDTGFDLVLNRSDYTLAGRIADLVSQKLSPASAVDGGTVRISWPEKYQYNRVAFLSLIENLDVDSTQEVAKVIVNERTGTIVIGNGVHLLPAAVAHGGITVTVNTTNAVSQPGALATSGQSIGVTNSQIDIKEQTGSLIELKANATLNDLVTALNNIGVTPSDLISILQALKAAGSLEATLEII
ncbi:MAG: flagellar basal body P-ring protein FlgI [Cyanobacteria bacterium]|nr:flagellar basal body P-ring protein FlgI [Cyanobacteriota bacterium]